MDTPDSGTLRPCVDHLCELAARDEDPEYLCGHDFSVYMCSEDCAIGN